MANQQTLGNSIRISGKEPYGGGYVTLNILPANPGYGIIFKALGRNIPATLENASTARHAISLKNDGAEITHVEHVLAGLYACGIDNAWVNVERSSKPRAYTLSRKLGLLGNVEVVPNIGGVTKELCDKIKDAGIEKQSKKRKLLRLKKEINLECKLIIQPMDKEGLDIMAYTNYKTIGHQSKQISITPEEFKEISMARSYARLVKWTYQTPAKLVFNDTVRSAIAGVVSHPYFGLGHGFSKEHVFIPELTKKAWKDAEIVEDEIAAHKIIDMVGALALLKGRLEGVKVTCNGDNHAMDVNFLRGNKGKFKFA